MSLGIQKLFACRVFLRAVFLPRVLHTGLFALLAMLLAAPAQAQPPVGATDVAAKEQTGGTIYQTRGLHGKIPLKKVQVVDPSGDTSHYELQFASGSMNTKMDFE